MGPLLEMHVGVVVAAGWRPRNEAGDRGGAPERVNRWLLVSDGLRRRELRFGLWGRTAGFGGRLEGVDVEVGQDRVGDVGICNSREDFARSSAALADQYSDSKTALE